MPPYLIYDNACQLMKHMQKKFNDSEKFTQRVQATKDVKYVVDRLHIVGHKQSWCQKMCHPDLYPQLAGVNTMVCEQINFWLGRYKYIMKHMSQTRFNFYLYIILNERNTLKVNGKILAEKYNPISKNFTHNNNENIFDIDENDFE